MLSRRHWYSSGAKHNNSLSRCCRIVAHLCSSTMPSHVPQKQSSIHNKDCFSELNAVQPGIKENRPRLMLRTVGVMYIAPTFSEGPHVRNLHIHVPIYYLTKQPDLTNNCKLSPIHNAMGGEISNERCCTMHIGSNHCLGSSPAKEPRPVI